MPKQRLIDLDNTSRPSQFNRSLKKFCAAHFPEPLICIYRTGTAYLQILGSTCYRTTSELVEAIHCLSEICDFLKKLPSRIYSFSGFAAWIPPAIFVTYVTPRPLCRCCVAAIQYRFCHQGACVCQVFLCSPGTHHTPN